MKNKIIENVAQKLDLPYWWVEAIAVEYTECREYVIDKKIWSFNFDKLSEKELEEAVLSHKVVTFCTLIHNVRKDVYSSRMLERMISDISSVPISEEYSDTIVEGMASDYHFPILFNTIDIWDPKLDFSSYFQVFDDGKFWQWHIADFVKVEGRNYGKWISSEIDLESLDQIHDKLALLQNNIVRQGKPNYEEFKNKIKEFYKWIDDIRRPILLALEDVHAKKKKAQIKFLKVTDCEPPLLSHFERFTVKEGNIMTKFYAEPVFFRSCKEHSEIAENAYISMKNDKYELASKLDKIYQERIVATICGQACLEAFINRLGFDHFPKIWQLVEFKLSLEDKWKLFLTLKGKDDILETGREPYQSFSKIIKIRNYLIHPKSQYEDVFLWTHNKAVTRIESDLQREFVRNLHVHIKALIEELCNSTQSPIPSWFNLD